MNSEPEPCPYCQTPLTTVSGADPAGITQSCENAQCSGRQGPERVGVS